MRSYSGSPFRSRRRSSSYSPEVFVFSPSQSKFSREDRISALPDSILVNILCLNDTREVVQTCAISSRWRSLWKSVPSLNLNLSSLSFNEKQFINFVDRVLLLRDEDVHIDRLCFSFSANISDDNLHNWINVAQRRHVQELELDLCANPGYDDLAALPTSIFTSSALKVFRLLGDPQITDVQLPNLICFAPRLQTIQLHFVRLPYEHSPDWTLVIGCPVLEELRVTNCRHSRYIGTLHISAPQLKKLVLDNGDSYCGNKDCKIVISTPCLTSLVLKGRMYRNYSLENLCSLASADLEFDESPIQDENIYDVVRGLHNATSLSLKICHKFKDIVDLGQFVNPFPNLRSLRLIGYSNVSCRTSVSDLLRNSSSIENLILEIDQVLSLKQDWGNLLKCIQCMNSVEIQGIRCRDRELEFLIFVLENAVNLESFSVVHKRSSRKTRKELAVFNKKVNKIRAASPKAEILCLG